MRMWLSITTLAIFAAASGSSADPASGRCGSGIGKEACHAIQEMQEVDSGVHLLQGAALQRARGREVQRTTGARRVAERLNRTLHALSTAVNDEQFRSRLPKPDCTAMPWLCGPPLRCDTPPTLQEYLGWKAQVSVDGHANPRSLCIYEDFWPNLIKDCMVNHDLKSHAQNMFDFQVQRGIGELDGSYCFTEGFCQDTVVTYDTTLEEAEKLCDVKFPNWKSVGLDYLQDTLWSILGLESKENGFSHPGPPRVYGELACATGGYHCDVIYCRDTYCQKDHYIQKYSHLQP